MEKSIPPEASDDQHKADKPAVLPASTEVVNVSNVLIDETRGRVSSNNGWNGEDDRFNKFPSYGSNDGGFPEHDDRYNQWPTFD